MLKWENLGPGARQKCRARTEAIAPIRLSLTLASASAVRCAARCEARFTTTFFPQWVQRCIFLGMDQPLEHVVIDDSDGYTIQSEQSPCAWCDLSPLSPDVAQLCPSLHKSRPTTQNTVDLGPHTGHAVHSESCVFPHHPGFRSPTSPSWSGPDVSELFPAPSSQDVSILYSTLSC